MKNAITIFFILSISHAMAQVEKAEQLIQTGNKWYQQKNYVQAEEQYKKALQVDASNDIATFNLANTYFRMNKPEEATQLFSSLIKYTQDKTLQENAYFNQGVVYSKQNNLEASIESYKNALRINPDDSAARENLQKALIAYKKKQQTNTKPKPVNNNPVSQKDQKSMEQKLDELEQKEKDIRERMQNDKTDKKDNKVKYW